MISIKLRVAAQAYRFQAKSIPLPEVLDLDLHFLYPANVGLEALLQGIKICAHGCSNLPTSSSLGN